ncbi:MerR family transcriptional regulator [Brachybacterium alimentarium]|uniref:MerR family transcriptional regulator n=1 Tax=Brachybacterium alimentarium TaxID=47845 RepID=A0A2A3YEI3_9MICO|nr:MerR family transcriptional regulator [Brachybacterium alimentarium]PCC37730.1 MerR family transcriptional regulator [Brachybacterium alimentarium]
MLSSELADLAGVTVRTLRHYHQIGLLAEPPRTSGDYRQYDVGHLVRVLRITRLTALGVPLSVLPEVLDDPTAADELLDQLDHQAAAEIERLTARRASIDVLRSTGAPPDLPPEFFAWYAEPGPVVPEDMVRYEREQLILIAHLLGEEGATGLAALLDVPKDTREATAVLTARFYDLDADTPDHEVEALIEEWVEQIRPLVETAEGMPSLDPLAPALLDQLGARGLRPVQHRAVRVLQQRLASEQAAHRRCRRQK